MYFLPLIEFLAQWSFYRLLLYHIQEIYFIIVTINILLLIGQKERGASKYFEEPLVT